MSSLPMRTALQFGQVSTFVGPQTKRSSISISGFPPRTHGLRRGLHSLRFAADVSLRIAAETYVCGGIGPIENPHFRQLRPEMGRPSSSVLFLIVTGGRTVMIQPLPTATR